MSISLNIEVNFVNISRLFRISFASFVSNLIDIFVNCNTKTSLIEFFRSFCFSDFSFDDNINLFYNVDNNEIFNDKIFL